MSKEFHHVTVLLHETIDMLDVKPDGIYVDATLGGAGHSEYLLTKLNESGHLYAFDQDQHAIENAKIRLAPFIEKGMVTFIKDNFRHLKERLNELGVTEIDGICYEKKAAQYKAQITSAKKNGTHCFILFIEKNAWKLLPFIKKEKDCAFFLFCPASCLTEKFLDAAKLTKNLFISVAYNKNNHKHPAPSTDVFKQLRIRKLPYAVHYYYSASDIENFKSGEIFKELSKERPLFSFFLSKKSDSVQDTVTEEDKKAVYEIIIKERYWLTYPSIPFAI